MARVPECQEEMMEFCCLNEETHFYEEDQPCLTKNALQSQRQSASCSQVHCEIDIQVEKISKRVPTKGFRNAVVIVVAVEKMRMNAKANIFTDDDLLDILNTILEPVSFDNNEFTYATDSIYRFNRALSYDIQDIKQKSFVLNQPAQLVAVHLQGSNLNHAVKLKMAVYRPKATGKNPVALGIKGSNLCLSCVPKEGAEGQPELQLEEGNILRHIDRSELGRFIFNRIDIGNTTRFESAAFPGWFICTSSQSNEAVGMTDKTGEASIIDYALTSPKQQLV